MSEKTQFVAAVDIGTAKIVALIGKRDPDGRIEIVASAKTESRGVRRGVVLNINEAYADVAKAIAEVREKSGMKFNEVYVGIAAQHVRCIKQHHFLNRSAAQSPITIEEIEQMKRDVSKTPIDPTEILLEIIPQSYMIDGEGEIENPIGAVGKRVECNYNIIACKKDAADNIRRCLEMNRLSVKDIMLEPLASAAAVISEDEKEIGVALVDIGGGTTDIAVFKNKELKHTAVIPFGGLSITNDIREECGILQRQAETLKLKYGSAFGDMMADSNKIVVVEIGPSRDKREISVPMLAKIIQARMEEIIEMAMFEIDNSGFADKLSAGIVITGGGAMLQHLPQLFSFKSGKQTRIGYPGSRFDKNLPEEMHHPLYSTSMGLLLNAFAKIDEGSTDCSSADFIKEEQAPEPVEQKAEISEEQETSKKAKAPSRPFGLKDIFRNINDKINKGLEDQSDVDDFM